MSSVLYDVPGPRARLRNRILGVVTVLVVAAGVAWTIWRLAETGQFSARKWELFTYSRVWEQFGQATIATLSAFAAAALGSVIYRGIIQLALNAGLNPNDMKLISAVLVVLALTVPKLSPLKRWRQQRIREKAVSEGVAV